VGPAGFWAGFLHRFCVDEDPSVGDVAVLGDAGNPRRSRPPGNRGARLDRECSVTGEVARVTPAINVRDNTPPEALRSPGASRACR
jgi:hypothetical protein